MGFLDGLVLSMFHKETPVPRVIPSRERIHIPPLEKENHLQKCLFGRIMLVPWRVAAKMIMKLESQVNPYSKHLDGCSHVVFTEQNSVVKNCKGAKENMQFDNLKNMQFDNLRRSIVTK